MQLVAYGAQDVYLTGNPQITFFKVVYKRHTNFAMELIQQTLSGSADFGNTVRCKISRAGDLLNNVWVNARMPRIRKTVTGDLDNTGGDDEKNYTNVTYCNRVGFRLLKSVELRVGGQQIDRHTSLWMHLWTELTLPAEKKGDNGLNHLVGGKGVWHSEHTHAGASAQTATSNPYSTCGSGSALAGNSMTSGSENVSGNGATDAEAVELWVPLQFSFCRNPGLALPLIALQYHEVELVIELEEFSNCLAHGENPRGHQNTSPTVTNDACAVTGRSLNNTLNVWGNYIFLDTEERKNFAQNPHEYLIETVQDMTTTITGSGRKNYRLNFNHPVKELVWVARHNNRTWTDEDVDIANDNIQNAQGVTLGPTNSADAGKGQRVWSGDSFTDFTSNARTVYNHTTDTDANDPWTAEARSAASYPGTVSTVDSAVLRLNGTERFAERTSAYFNRVQPYQHHTGCPDLGVNSYSFALKPEEHQPSGTCNFSRIDNAELNVNCNVDSGTLSVFAHGYNVLRVASGMGGLAYSN